MYIAAERAKDGVAPQPTAPHSNTQTEERPPLIIRSNQSEMAEEGEGEITVIYHHYVRTTRMTPEPVESGGGISAYCWVLYPVSYIENFKRNVTEFGETATLISLDGYRMQGTRDDAAEAVKALEKGNEVFCRLRRPAALPLKVPAGKYYLDYWIELRHNSGWGTDVFGPRSVNRRDGRDWGPYEITVTPNSQLKINVTPYGDNVEGKNVYRRDGFSGKGLWNLINYSDRLP